MAIISLILILLPELIMVKRFIKQVFKSLTNSLIMLCFYFFWFNVLKLLTTIQALSGFEALVAVYPFKTLSGFSLMPWLSSWFSLSSNHDLRQFLLCFICRAAECGLKVKCLIRGNTRTIKMLINPAPMVGRVTLPFPIDCLLRQNFWVAASFDK